MKLCNTLQLVPMSLLSLCGFQTPNGIIFSSGTNIIEGKAQEHTRTHKLKHTIDRVLKQREGLGKLSRLRHKGITVRLNKIIAHDKV